MAADAADENLMPEEQDEDDSDADDHASKHKKTMMSPPSLVAVVIAAVVGFFIGNGGFGGKGRQLGYPHRGPARFDRGEAIATTARRRYHRARGHREPV